ncbi:MAG: polysaccharide deacetylase family protein, partial [Thermotogota bacterium]|nr:polysaccharide deacetylase family protein [Thermotogota bacterium]
MKSLQIFIYSALSTRPTLKILRYLTANKINILMYHGVIEDEDDLDCWWMLKRSAFERQIEYIHKHFRVVSLDEALDVIFTKKTKAKNLVVLTFDDGYRNFLDIVLPVLQSFDMPCIVYVTTGMVQHNSHIWTDQLFHSFHNSKKIEIDFSDLKLGTWRFDNKIYRRITSHKIIDILKTLPVEEKNDLKKRIIERLRETNSPEERDTVFDLLTIDDIKRISQQALVALGCHTMNHEILTKLPFDMAMNEI